MSAIKFGFGRVLVAATVAFGWCLGAAKDARATLGGDVGSVADNQQHLGGARQVQKLASGERHEIQLPSGIVVHEYVSSTGVVYAIAWHGPRMPDLRELVGPYFTQLVAHDSRPRGGHHRMTMTGVDFMLQSIGHRRSFSGRAWVPSLVPPGVTIDASID